MRIMTGDLAAIFQEYGDGCSLTAQQAWTAVCITGRNPTSQDIRSFWQRKGLTADSTIDVDGFRELVGCIPAPSRTDMMEALAKFDKENTGFIDKSSLLSILARADDVFGTKMNEDDEVIGDLIHRGDINNDGLLSVEMLATMVVGDVEAIPVDVIDKTNEANIDNETTVEDNNITEQTYQKEADETNAANDINNEVQY